MDEQTVQIGRISRNDPGQKLEIVATTNNKQNAQKIISQLAEQNYKTYKYTMTEPFLHPVLPGMERSDR